MNQAVCSCCCRWSAGSQVARVTRLPVCCTLQLQTYPGVSTHMTPHGVCQWARCSQLMRRGYHIPILRAPVASSTCRLTGCGSPKPPVIFMRNHVRGARRNIALCCGTYTRPARISEGRLCGQLLIRALLTKFSRFLEYSE